MLDAAALAAILDPERQLSGWWDTAFRCSLCKQSTDGPARDRSTCYWNTHEGEVAAVLAPSYEYIGPANLHTAREHNWRLEDWLLERGCRIYRNRRGDGLTEVIRDHDGWMCFPPNHTAALVAAIERISNGI